MIKYAKADVVQYLSAPGWGNKNMLTMDARTQIEKADACIGAVRLLEVCPKEKPSLQSIDLWKL